MKRTTILADEQLLYEAKILASRRGTTLTAIVREALASYLAQERTPPALSLIGIGSSGVSDTSKRVDEILAAEIDPIEGWSPRRKPSSGEGA